MTITGLFESPAATADDDDDDDEDEDEDDGKGSHAGAVASARPDFIEFWTRSSESFAATPSRPKMNSTGILPTCSWSPPPMWMMQSAP
eukprot:CAMPEP_0194778594 /NCGR_PEP_ID=MMETSP0323_2-20130528/68625_1 /TAXON_ID=2866 ORGANISM="Crypthecodinium cohnii, Strain Seligo" /NCGR_SAMPLE_ID=MMETSP0323_2 /ASSEMBLY_ACC=CAM_ASM_000346 /LENGTH=87 /DNA_ID=CAMNT_0039715873 /DNA_START=1374 /DNA_END=1640 /DNA_ORIENTATION=+